MRQVITADEVDHPTIYVYISAYIPPDRQDGALFFTKIEIDNIPSDGPFGFSSLQTTHKGKIEDFQEIAKADVDFVTTASLAFDARPPKNCQSSLLLDACACPETRATTRLPAQSTSLSI
jgi:hypothetical protein